MLRFSFQVLMAICDAQYRFLCVDIGKPGSESDGGVFARSAMGRSFEQYALHFPKPRPLEHHGPEMPFVLVGDEAFPLKPYLMRPYPRIAGLDYAKKVFNYRLSRARRVVENAFGILANRWRILRRPFKASLENTTAYVSACIALHNFLLSGAQSRPIYSPPGLADFEDELRDVFDGDWRDDDGAGLNSIGHRLGSNNYKRQSAEVRKLYTHYFVTGGVVPWQERIVNRKG